MNIEAIIISAVVLLFDIPFFLALRQLFRRRRRESRAKLASFVEGEGWQLLPAQDSSEIYRVEGTLAEGIGWEMVARSSGKHSRRQTTTWRTTDIHLKNGIIAFGPGIALSVHDINLGHRLIQKALQRMFGDEIATALADTRMIEIEDKEFSRHYSVFADNEERARQFLADPLRPILTDWRSEKLPFPGMVFWENGMQVKFSEAIAEPEQMEKILNLCSLLALRGREMGT